MITNTRSTLPGQAGDRQDDADRGADAHRDEGVTFGSVVLKLLAAMNDEKQAGGKAAIARRKDIHLKAVAPRITGIRLTGFRMKPPDSLPASTAFVAEFGRAVDPGHDQHREPGGQDDGHGDARRGRPSATSLASRLLVPKSTPAAPAVAKKPTT